jgi:hypothetical protein
MDIRTYRVSRDTKTHRKSSVSATFCLSPFPGEEKGFGVKVEAFSYGKRRWDELRNPTDGGNRVLGSAPIKLNRKEKRFKIIIMATIILDVQDESLLTQIKKACQLLKGVASVRVHKEPKARVEDITKTAGYKEAMDDIKHGRVTEYASLKDFYKEMGL